MSSYPPLFNKPPALMIGLVGSSAVGRATVAGRLKHAHGFALAHFERPAREAMYALCGVSPFDLLAHPTAKLEPFGLSPRELIAKLEEFGRELGGPDFIVQRLEAAIKARGDWQHDLVIPDAKRPEEIRWIRAQGGAIVWIHESTMAGLLEPCTHSDLTPGDQFITSDTHTGSQLEEAADQALAKLRARYTTTTNEEAINS